MTRSEHDIPSDIRHFDYINYVYDPEGVRTLVGKLRVFIQQSLRLPTPPSESNTANV